jgi:hypothetical protein
MMQGINFTYCVTFNVLSIWLSIGLCSKFEDIRGLLTKSVHQTVYATKLLLIILCLKDNIKMCFIFRKILCEVVDGM